MQNGSFVVATSTNPTPPSTEKAIPTHKPSAITTTPSSPQYSVAEPSIKDYIPVSIVVVVIAGLMAIIGTLIWKWHEAEVKRIEAQKDSEVARINIEKYGEIKILDEQRKRELSEKDTKIMILESEIRTLKREQEIFKEITSIAPIQFLRDTKPALELIINELREKIKSLTREEKDDRSVEKDKIILELESKLTTFENNLHKLSILEKHLAERAAHIQEASLWLEGNQTRLAEEACQASLQYLNVQGKSAEEIKMDFINDVNDYLMIIGKCLNLGRTNLIDKIMVEIAPVVEPKLYANVFTLIKDEKMPSELNNDGARREIEIYLSYLIEKFKSYSS